MAKIKLNDIQLVYDGETMIISSVKEPDKCVSLDAKSVEELVDFVHLLAPVTPVPAVAKTATTEKSKPAGANRREAFRVPVSDDWGLTVTLFAGKNRFQTKANNISMTGVFVEMPTGQSLDLKIDDQVRARLSMDDMNVTVDAVVRRSVESGYGLFFPESMKGEHVTPPPEIRRIVMELQRRWMTLRSDV